MSPSRWAPIEEMIREFQGFLRPNVPQFKIEKGVDCADSYPTSRAASFPLDRKGVYLIFDDSESLRYIGATIERPLFARCREHRAESKPYTQRWIDVIPFDKEWEFFALSLESYLIIRVKRTKEYALVNHRLNSRLELSKEDTDDY